jgi:Glu-tRNA(Gln) amidotransferase subunit E-like FAD-binding protein
MNYKELKFKAGLEIHQQLETHKLFCNCPSLLTNEKPSININRRLRAVAGESNEIDIAALHETLKNKEFIYEGFEENNCSVEFDEEPPHEVNKDALDIVLQVALILNAKIPDELQVMRKTVIDGSNTSGFQRTILVGRDGILNTSKGKVGISVICLEEDSARKLKEDKNSVTFRLDRLGIPLIEIGTDPDIKDPEHAKEVAETLGMILRSTGKVKRGIGTIRQDVNISIKNGARVEIKGFQNLKKMPLIINNEIKRQQKIKTKPEVRKANPDNSTTFLRPIPGAARMYPETDIKPIQITNTLLKSIKKPELISKKVEKYEKIGIPTNTARELIKQNIKLEDYNFKLDKKIITNILIEIPKEIHSREKTNYKFKKQDFNLVLSILEKKEITKEAAYEILVDISKGKKPNLSKYKVNISDIELEIEKIIQKNKDLSLGALMGDIMKKYRGKIGGKEVVKLISKYKN